MEQVNTEETSQPSTDLPESPAPLLQSSSGSHENLQDSSQAQQQRSDEDERNSDKAAAEIMDPKSHVDTAPPIDSVKGAATKFGGIRDSKEKRVPVQDELDKTQRELTEYQKRSQEAECDKARALKELESTTRVTDDLRLSLQTAQVEEAQARRETELAELRLQELRRAAGESAAAKAELDVVRDRREAALAELQSVRAELASLEKERAAAAADADALLPRARESAASSRVAGMAVEGLAAELIALKGELESSHAAHRAAEEKRLVLAAQFEQDKSRWQGELEEAEHEAKKLRDELMAAYDLELKAEAASKVLASRKTQLLACNAGQGTTKAMLEKLKNELEDVKESIEKAKYEASCLRVAASSMRDGLEREKAELAAMQRKQAMSAASIPSLEEELNRATSELAAAAAEAVRGKDQSRTDEQVGAARREAEQAKGKAQSALEEAREDASVAKAAVAAVEARLEAVAREIHASNTSAEVATASANALLLPPPPPQESEEGAGVMLTTEEYEELSRKVREVEEAAGKRVVEAVKLIKEAKDAEVRSLEKLTRAAKQTEQRRQALQAATEEAEEAKFAKLSAERELRQWRAEQEHQQNPRAGLAEISVLRDGRANPHILSPRGYMPRTDVMLAAGAAAEAESRHRKTTFLPRVITFLARKRAQTWK